MVRRVRQVQRPSTCMSIFKPITRTYLVPWATMEQKSDRRHTADELTQKGSGSKDVKGAATTDDYSLEQKFSDFVKLSSDVEADSDRKGARDEAARRFPESGDSKAVTAPGKGDSGQVKDGALSTDEDDVADREFEHLMHAPSEGSVALAADPKARSMALGFGM